MALELIDELTTPNTSYTTRAVERAPSSNPIRCAVSAGAYLSAGGSFVPVRIGTVLYSVEP